jgi:hypothetical protein
MRHPTPIPGNSQSEDRKDVTCERDLPGIVLGSLRILQLT